jgi:ADP-ribose pyrophosphatase YjhB (NUDIX family)/phosphohistidine phosphatase SixA
MKPTHMTARTSIEIAAGGVVWRIRKGKVEILLAHRPKYDDWAYPKGKLDPGESIISCAHREVHEETGLTFDIGRRVAITDYIKPSGRPKHVYYWAMRLVSGDFVPNDEVDDIAWVRPSKAPLLLTYDRDRQVLEDLPKSWRRPATRLLLIRHAHAGSRSTWNSDDLTRPLSDRGEGQSKELIGALTGFRIDRLLTSPATRCIDTVRPLAKARDMNAEVIEDLYEDRKSKTARSVIVDKLEGTLAVCTHRTHLVSLLHHYLRDEPTGYVPPHGKGSAWVFDFRRGRVIDSHYLAPTT